MDKKLIISKKNILKRFMETPLYFKVVVFLLLLDSALAPIVHLLPDEVKGKWHELGNIWSFMIVYFAFVVVRRNVWLFRTVGVLFSCITIWSTIGNYLLHTPSEFPSNPYLVFYPYQWVSGVAFPLFVIFFVLLIPSSALPLRNTEEKHTHKFTIRTSSNTV